MKKLQYIALAVAALLSASATAQESRKFTADKQNEYGLVYALPITHLNIEVEAVKTVKKAGPYYKYAKKYIGVSDVITEDSQTWTVKSITVTPNGVPDKNREYLMQFKGGTAPYLMLDGEGLPLSINAEADEAVVKRKRNQLDDKTVFTGADYASAFSEDMAASESTMKRAEAAASKLFEIRENRNDLASGNADQMPPDGASLKLMLDELNRQEAILTAMFLGTTQTETKVFRFDYVPTGDVSQEVVCRVSNYNGVVDKSDLSGDPVYLDLKVTERGELPANEKGEPKKLPKNAVMYNIPGKAHVVLRFGGKTVADAEVEVSQFGIDFGLDPKLFTDKKAPAFVKFNPETGAIREIGTITPSAPAE